MTVYEIVNDIIVTKLKEGVVPWKKLWRSKNSLLPMSLTTGKFYNGTNQILLSCLTTTDYSTPYFLTYNQASERGGYIKQGEKGVPVVFFKVIDNEDEEITKPKFILRYYKVFNLDQCEDIKLTTREKELLQSLEVESKSLIYNNYAENLINSYYEMPKLDIKPSYNPVYNITKDTIRMPPLEQFESSEEYYATLFHELIHSTGHNTRLNRLTGGRKGEEKAIEELVGEIGSAYLSFDSNILDKVVDNNAAYIDYWIEKIDKNPRLFISATSKAEKAYSFIQSHSVLKEAV